MTASGGASRTGNQHSSDQYNDHVPQQNISNSTSIPGNEAKRTMSRIPTHTESSSPSSSNHPSSNKEQQHQKSNTNNQNLTKPRSHTHPLTPTISRQPSATTPPKFTLSHEIGFISIICLSQLLTQAGLAQSIAPLHTIGNSFSVSNPGQLSWLPAAYSLTVGTFILPAGRWGDLYGHRLLFIIGYLWFGLWSLIAGFAVWSHSFVFFAICRALQGIGPAMLIPNALAILGRTYPPGERKNMVFALFGATAPGGFIFGAALSGIFAQLVWWPWIYWVSGGLLVCCAVGVLFVVPDMPVAGGGGVGNKWVELDVWGTITGVVGLILVNFAWNQGPSVGWDQVYVYVLLIVGAIVLALFFWVEFKVSVYPLLPKDAFNLDNSLVLGCIAAGWGSFGIWVYYFWQYMELITGSSILLSTAKASPTAISGALAAVVTGRLLGSIGPGWVMLIAMFAFCIGNILLATVPAHQTYWAQTFVSTIITPFGMDMSFPAGTIVLSNFMPPEHQGMAASILCVIQNYSISIGLGMAGTVEAHVSGGDLLKGYRGAWYLGIGLDVLGIALAVCLVLSLISAAKAKRRASEKVKLEEV